MGNKKLKSQKGAISVFVMITMLFFLVTIVGAYMISSRRAQSQSEALEMAQDKYYKDGEEEVIYDSKIMNSSVKNPVYTKEHYWAIGEDAAVEIDGKVYDFSSTDYANYELQNDIIINMETDLKNSKFKDDLFYGDEISKNGHEVLYYYQGKYYVPVAYNDGGTSEITLASEGKTLSASGTNFSTISSQVSGLSGKYYLFGEKNGGGATVEIPEGLEVGDYVTYSPSGTYNWQAEYASSDFATDGSKDITLSSASGQEFCLTQWRVLSIDESSGKVELVPTTPTRGSLWLQGAQGYNNAVYLLNDACNNLYGNSAKGISARSIRYEDFEAENSVFEIEYLQMDTEYTGEDAEYPIIYEQEDLSVITYYGSTNATKIEKGAGLGISEQEQLIEREDKGAVSKVTGELGAITTATSIRPYYVGRSLDYQMIEEALGEKASYFLPNGESTSYWIASRGCEETSGGPVFKVWGVFESFWDRNMVNYEYYLRFQWGREYLWGGTTYIPNS